MKIFSTIRAVLRDPFYRYEVRRYWTWRRYLGTSLTVLVWSALIVLLFPNLLAGSAVYRSGINPQPIITATCIALLGRIPLSLLTAVGAAVSILPERISGQIEQFVITPIDPWRFCLARYLARLKGLPVMWALAGGLLFAALFLLPETVTREACLPADAGRALPVFLFLAALHLDWAVMLMADAAIGLRHSVNSGSTAGLLAKTLLHTCVMVPITFFLAALAGAALAAAFLVIVGAGEHWWFLMAGAFGFRLALGALLIGDELWRVRRGAERIFYEPEDRL